MPNSYTFTQWVNHLFYNLSLFSFYIYKTQVKKLIVKAALASFYSHLQ